MYKKWLCSIFILLGGCTHQPLITEDAIDITRYIGTWHEQYRLPNRFQKQCVADISAQYSLMPANKIEVINKCKTEDGNYIEAKGVARINTKQKPIKSSILEVRFAPEWLAWWPGVWGDYWIIKITDNYDHVLVGSPDRQYLWLLSRDKMADPNTIRILFDVASKQGFDVDQLIQSEP